MYIKLYNDNGSLHNSQVLSLFTRYPRGQAWTIEKYINEKTMNFYLTPQAVSFVWYPQYLPGQIDIFDLSKICLLMR
jgi:hypothetical protein